jgi:hypothetical protein
VSSPGYYTRARWTEPGEDTARGDQGGQA